MPRFTGLKYKMLVVSDLHLEKASAYAGGWTDAAAL